LENNFERFGGNKSTYDSANSYESSLFVDVSGHFCCFELIPRFNPNLFRDSCRISCRKVIPRI